MPTVYKNQTCLKLRVFWSTYFYSWHTFCFYCRQDPGKRTLWELVTLSEVAQKESLRKLCRLFFRGLKPLNIRLIFSSGFHLLRCGDIWLRFRGYGLTSGSEQCRLHRSAWSSVSTAVRVGLSFISFEHAVWLHAWFGKLVFTCHVFSMSWLFYPMTLCAHKKFYLSHTCLNLSSYWYFVRG